MNEPSNGQNELANSRIKQVFEYLKALNDHRNPAIRQVKEHPWHFWLDDLPDHPDVELATLVRQQATGATDAGSENACYVFRARRPTLTSSPVPPPEILDWLHSGWEDPKNDARFLTSRNQAEHSGETATIRFEASPARPAAFALWQQKRERWREAELPAREAMAVFEEFYSLHGTLERESELFDLVVADGILSWQRPEGSIYHPLLAKRVQLEFDPKVPEFRIADTDALSELCIGLFQTDPDVSPAVLAARRQEFDDNGYHPLSLEATAFLEGFINHISSKGEFLDNGRPEQGCEQPTLGRGPLLLRRSRTKGFGTAIEQVINSVGSRSDFCDALASIVGVERPHAGGEPAGKPSTAERDILLGKAANQEQFRIIRQLERHSSVLVQGPPGTGKSHTIANLIGHVLAHGQSVLVTSHTTKALRVLRDQVVEKLTPLCVSVLGNDLGNREQLKESVRRIADRLGRSDADELEVAAGILDRQRNELLDAHERLRAELLRARTDEYRAIVFGGDGISPADAAREVAAGRGQHDWIPSPVALGEPMPLSAKEVDELYATNAVTSACDDRFVAWSFPPVDAVPSPDEFALALGQGQPQIDIRLWKGAIDWAGRGQEINQLVQSFRDAIREFRGFTGWQLAAVDAGRGHAGMRRLWEELLKKAQEISALAAEVQADYIAHRPYAAGVPTLEAQWEVADQACKHLIEGGELKDHGLFRRGIRTEWREAYRAWLVNGHPPETLDEFAAIRRLLAVKIGRAEVAKLWDGLVVADHAEAEASAQDEPERAPAMLARTIADCMSWWERRCSPLVGRLCALGFDWSKFLGQQPVNVGKYGEMLRCVNAVESSLIGELQRALEHSRGRKAADNVVGAFKRLEPFGRPEVVEIRHAMQARDPVRYRSAVRNYRDAADRQATAQRRNELLGRIERRASSGVPVAERWAASIRNRSGEHGKTTTPGDAAAAWRWRQLNDELDRRAELDIAAVGAAAAEIQEQLRRTTAELIDHRAWTAQVRRTSLKQRQALMGWLDTVKPGRASTGKRAALLLREAQRLMGECRTAVPVWIMPLVRLAESFDFSKQCFDIVIIDEASQSDVMELLALAIAKKVVIVGDDEQVSPLGVGQALAPIDHLIRLHLKGVPNSHLFDPKLSIYDLAKQSFEAPVRLVEHFRCVPDIIQFSNYLCYGGDIKPLREEGSSPLRPAIVPFRVDGTRHTTADVNREEALTVASLLAAAIERPEYAGMTFGVISLKGDEQAYEIDQLVRRHVPPEEYQRRRIICGNSAHFQGDERDVIFLSMVWSPDGAPLRRVNDTRFRQRFNVAASRARDQMWLIYSLDPKDDLKSDDLRRRLIEHAIDPRAITRELERKLERAQSPFEKQVLGYLVRAGFRVTPQWPVGSYRIDIVVEGGGQRLALECDGDRYHTLDNLPADMERQAVLERLGWRFVRIRGSSFFRDPEGTMKGVFEKLDEAGTAPESAPQRETGEEDTVVSAIRRRAAELRSEWEMQLGPGNGNAAAASSSPSDAGPRREPIENGEPAAAASDPSAGPVPSSPERPPQREETPPTSPEIAVQTAPPATSSPIGARGHVVSEGERGARVGESVEAQSVKRLLGILDATIFPAVAGTEPRGSRRDRIERWRAAVESCERTAEALHAALADCDPAIRGNDRVKAVTAIRRWCIGDDKIEAR
jgi:very-short-patch-repair endonuclease